MGRTAAVPDFMGKHRTIGLRAKVDVEVGVDLEPAVDAVHVNLQQVAALLCQVGVKLLVPRGKQRVGYVQTLAVQTASYIYARLSMESSISAPQLQHLWAALQRVSLYSRHRGSLCEPVWQVARRNDPATLHSDYWLHGNQCTAHAMPF